MNQLTMNLHHVGDDRFATAAIESWRRHERLVVWMFAAIFSGAIWLLTAEFFLRL